MIAKSLMGETIPFLEADDSGEKALALMEEYKVSHLPIVSKDSFFLGLISESDIHNESNLNKIVGKYVLSLNRPFVEQYQHVFDVFRVIVESKLTLVPVLDAKNKCLGVITLRSFVNNYGGGSSVQGHGSVIVLELNVNDYSLSQISQIVESNNIKIINLIVMSQPDSTKIEVSMKLNKVDIAAIIQTFNRYNYTIKASYTEDSHWDGLKDRLDSFMNYLNI